MELRDLSLPSLNQFTSDYLNGKLEVEDYFHYKLTGEGMYQNRYQELMTRTFKRADIAAYIEQYMERLSKSKQVELNIEALKTADSVVVIGGQQAGLLSGPLYTIHKVISIIKLAEEQEKKLGKRVIPVFWIAGEDHDLAEVNHVYTMKNGKPVKTAYPFYHPFKTMVTDLELDTEKTMQWIEDVVESYGETDFTKKLLETVRGIVQESKDFVEFFASLIHEWFQDYGLLLLDAGDPRLRKLEADYFSELIQHSDEITDSVLSQQAFMQKEGYKRMIEMEDASANLFYYTPKNKERILLERKGDLFSSKNGDIRFTISELLEVAEKEPERLSNNVVTRPIMQEKLFPVLAFISGPGEIAYWAELKRAFEIFSMKMPPIVPRLNITVVERGIQTDLSETGLDIETVLTQGTGIAVNEFMNSVKNDDIESLFRQMKSTLGENHEKLTEKAVADDKGLEPLLIKNRQFLDKQLNFIYGKITESTEKKHEVTLSKYSRIANALYPIGSPQERIWNVFYYLNQYGPCFISDTMKLDYQFNNQHKVIYL